MRVLQLGPFPPPHGGVQTNLVAIRDHLRANGHQAAVIHLTRHRRENADDVFYPASALETARLLLADPADVIHLHIGGDLTKRLLGLCLFCSLLPRRKTVLTFHSGGYPSSPAGRAMGHNSFAGFVLRRLDASIAVNEEIAEFLRRCGARNVRVITPVSRLHVAPALPEPLLSFYQAHNPVLLSVGLLEPEYDLPLQIAALGRVRERHRQAGLVMIGSGSLEQELRAKMAAQPWAAHMLLPGDVEHSVTLRALQECNAVLRTTHYDGDSISVREALALGAPVIATDNRMRPPGCVLIPGPSMEPLLAAIEQVLAASTKVTLPLGDTEHLDAVLQIYAGLVHV